MGRKAHTCPRRDARGWHPASCTFLRACGQRAPLRIGPPGTAPEPRGSQSWACRGPSHGAVPQLRGQPGAGGALGLLQQRRLPAGRRGRRPRLCALQHLPPVACVLAELPPPVQQLLQGRAFVLREPQLVDYLREDRGEAGPLTSLTPSGGPAKGARGQRGGRAVTPASTGGRPGAARGPTYHPGDPRKSNVHVLDCHVQSHPFT